MRGNHLVQHAWYAFNSRREAGMGSIAQKSTPLV